MVFKVSGLKSIDGIIVSVVEILSEYNVKVILDNGTVKIISFSDIEIDELNVSKSGTNCMNKILNMMIEIQNTEVLLSDNRLSKKIISAYSQKLKHGTEKKYG